MTEEPVRLRLDQPAVYSIRVQGQVSQHWMNYLDDMQVSVEGEDGWAITTLTGPVIDQAALHGLLQKLYTLGLVLICIERKE